MRRVLALFAIVAAGLLSQGAMWFGCANTNAERERANTATIEKVRDNLFVVKGGGGNTAVLVTSKGVVLVDTKNPGWGPAILEQIRTVTDKPVTTIINTHMHRDHVSGNPFFGASVDIVAHQRAKEHLADTMVALEGYDPRFLPNRTFTDRMSLTRGEQRIDLYHFGAGHTDNDIVVVFPALRAAHVGDLFADKVLPIIDFAHGGNALALRETLAEAAAEIRDVDVVVTGHSEQMAWRDFEEHSMFNRDFVDWAKEQWEAGVSAEAAAERYRLPDKYKEYRVAVRQARSYVEQIYDDLEKPVTPPRRWWGGVG